MPDHLLMVSRDATRRICASRARGRWTAVVAGAALLAAAGCALAQSSQSKGPVAYRWTDEHGIVHYGDHIPPQYAQQESAVLNGQGVQVGKVAAHKTGAEAEEEARKEAQIVQQKQRDAFLLSTYTSEKDIEELRDERLQQLSGQRQAAEQYIASLRERLLALQTRAQMFKPYNNDAHAQRLPDDLAEDMSRALSDMRVQRNTIATKDQEEVATRAQFQSDIDRFRQLHSPGSAEPVR